MNLKYDHYREVFAKRCTICNGDMRVLYKGIWTACPCQMNATMKFRFDRIPIHPPELKYKTWDDFTGLVLDSNGEVVSSLDPESLIEGKQKALSYCYKNGDNSTWKNMVIQKHLVDGQNVVIVGRKSSGKSLLALLIVKELVNYTIHTHNVVDFQWAHSSDIRQSARWQITFGEMDKAQNFEYLDDLALTDFLVVDGLDFEGKEGSHTAPPDRTSLDVLFGDRKRNNRPTVFICTERLAKMLHPRYSEQFCMRWGTELHDLLTSARNVRIDLNILEMR